MKSLKECPVAVVDVGASGGLSPRWENITPHFLAILFEPDQKAYEGLTAQPGKNYIILNSALADTCGEAEFYSCRSQGASSVRLPNYPVLEKFPEAGRYEITAQTKIKTDTLQSLLEKNGIADIDFIKVDTQGSELDILKGAGKLLEDVIGLEVEVEFIPIYMEQPLFCEVNGFITDFGFQLYDMNRYFWKRTAARYVANTRGQLIFGDALYFKSPETVLSLHGNHPEKVMHAMVVYLAYRYYDLAEILLCLSRDVLAGSDGILREMEAMFRRSSAGFALPEFRGKGRIFNFLSKCAGFFAPNQWNTRDRATGGNR